MRNLFRKDSEMLRLRHCYRLTFATPEGQEVLNDIYRAGRVAYAMAVSGDPIQTGVNDGLRQMAMHISNRLNMSDEEILRKAQETTIDRES